VKDDDLPDAVEPPATMSWSIKKSFWDYVRDADGEVSTIGGARIRGAEVEFPANPETDDDDSSLRDDTSHVVRYCGGVKFTAHYGMLTVIIQDPWVETTANGTLLTIHDGESEGTPTRIVFATLYPQDPIESDNFIAFREVPTSLSPQGSALFSFNYQAGSELEPISYAMKK